MRRPFAAVVVVAVLVAAAGCGGSTGSSAVSTHRPETIRVDEAWNGRTVHAHVGDAVAVTLHSTYWSLAAPPGPVLQVVEAATGRPGAATGCPSFPGSGCGSVTATYRAAATGTTRLAAQRSSCGEALRCRPGQTGWTVTVEVG